MFMDVLYSGTRLGEVSFRDSEIRGGGGTVAGGRAAYIILVNLSSNSGRS